MKIRKAMRIARGRALRISIPGVLLDATFLIADGHVYRGDVHDTAFKRFNNSRLGIAILPDFAFLQHSEMHSFRNSEFMNILYSEKGKEQF